MGLPGAVRAKAAGALAAGEARREARLRADPR